MSSAPSKSNRVRLIGGDWRSRVLNFADLPELRPTPDRVRETLFNWLQFSIVGARCLDLFAGSGALGFEALSRGAASVTALETHPSAVAALRANAQALGTSALGIVQKDAMQWLDQPALQQFNMVFLDPPFAAGLHARCCELLQSRHWLSPGARVYIESGEDIEKLTLPMSWSLTHHKRAGDVFYGLCETGDPAESEAHRSSL